MPGLNGSLVPRRLPYHRRGNWGARGCARPLVAVHWSVTAVANFGAGDRRMKAFLSHSSKDKAFVREVGSLLGEAQCEYDEYTFEHTLNTSAIHSALQRCDVFVLFLSANSTKSSF